MLKALIIFGMLGFILTAETADSSDSSSWVDIILSKIAYLHSNYGIEISTALIITAIYLAIQIFREEKERKQLAGLKSTRRISVDEYERNKVIQTKAALAHLEATPEYQSLKNRFEAGEWAKTEIDEEDKIVLSDDDE